MRNYLLLLVWGLLCFTTAIAQTHTISGKILGNNGQPLEGASIQIKGTSQGTTADPQGNFRINAKPGDILVISAISYLPKQIRVGNQESISISLEPGRTAALQEVVVTALGQTQTKAKVGYSTQTFSTAAINKNGAVSLLDGLQGKIAGADISTTGGPGSSTKVVLRGYGVIAGGSNQPLYVIDGVPMSDAIFQAQTNIGTDAADYGNGMTNLNPNDIETVTILKGTAASSLYGGLAKNGAIMITTKKGKAGKLKVEFSSSANFSTVGKLPDYQSEFGQGWGGVFVLDENGSWGPRLDGKVRKWGSIVNGDQLSKPFSAIKDPLRQFYTTGHEYNNSIALSGGSEANRFYFSYSNVTSNGVVPMNANTQQRNTISMRTNSNYDAFTINTSINYIGQNLKVPNTGQNTSSGGGVFQSLLQIPVDLPIGQFKDINNKFFNFDNYWNAYAENPYFGLIQNGNQQKLDRIFGNLDFGYKFSNEFSAELRVGGDITNARTLIWKNSAYSKTGSWVGPNPTNPEGAVKNPDFGTVSQGSDYFSIFNGDFILKYTKELNRDFSLNALAGVNYYGSNQRTQLATVTNLIVPGFYNLSNSNKPPTTLDQTFLRRREGVYGQVTVGYLDQLYLTGNVRNDWSSTLPINHNSIFYPGANLSWVASQLLSSKNILSYLKLRAAYGRTGSDPGPYQVLPTLGSGTINLPFGTLSMPFNGVSGYGVSDQINNPNLKPILTDEVEVGAEARFLRDRIGLDLSLYNRRTKGQIFAVPIAPSTGYTTLVENLGTVENKGIELGLNLRPIELKDFRWNIDYNFTKNWNKVIQLTGIQDPLLLGFSSAIDAELRAVVGKTVASIYSGVPQKAPNGQVVVNPQTGFPLPNTSVLDKFGHTKGYYGSALYDYTMGMTNTFTYKNFTLSGTLDFRYGGVMYSNVADLTLFVGNSITTTYNDRRPFIYPNSVIQTGPKTFVPNTRFIGATGAGQTDQYYNAYSESNSFSGAADAYRIIDRSFLKLRDINLAYNLPKSFMSRIKASGGTFGVYARNILLWTPKSNVYVDPEATNAGNDLVGEMGEFAGTPLSKNFGVILKVVF